MTIHRLITKNHRHNTLAYKTLEFHNNIILLDNKCRIPRSLLNSLRFTTTCFLPSVRTSSLRWESISWQEFPPTSQAPTTVFSKMSNFALTNPSKYTHIDNRGGWVKIFKLLTISFSYFLLLCILKSFELTH